MLKTLKALLAVFDTLAVATMMATLAAITGVLALSGVLSKKIIASCTAIAVIGIIATVLQVANILKQQRIRRMLAERLEKGRELYGAIDYQWPRDTAIQIKDWASSVESILDDWKGDGSYVLLFRPAQLTYVGLILDVFPENSPEALRVSDSNGLCVHLRDFMNHRLEMLEEFIREIKT